jgi:hypothetical protein
VYTDLLGHTVQPGDTVAAGYLSELSGGTSRQQVALQIEKTLECRAELVASLFDRYLQRSKPSPQTNPPTGVPPMQPFGSTGQPLDSEVAFYAGLMFNNNFTQEQIVAFLMSSPEYFLEPHPFP